MIPKTETAAHRTAKLLTDAISVGDASKVADLIDNGAGVDQCDTLGQLPMFVATRDGKNEIVRLLIARGANPNDPVDDSGRTALIHAASNGYLDIVRTLIDSGASMDAVDNFGLSALWICAHSLANEWVNKPDLAAWRSAQNQSPTGRVAIIEQLISRGANINLSPKAADSAARLIRDTKIPRLITLLDGAEKSAPRKSFLAKLLRQ